MREVIGAGPSGLAAGLTFARAGEPVRVLERHKRVAQFKDPAYGVLALMQKWRWPPPVARHSLEPM